MNNHWGLAAQRRQLDITECYRRSSFGMPGRPMTLLEQAARMRREAEEAPDVVNKDCDTVKHYHDGEEEKEKKEGVSESRLFGQRRLLRGF